MGIAIMKEKFTTAGEITLDIVNEMIANGFKAIFPVDEGGLFKPPVGSAIDKWVCVLEATGDVDPLNKTEVATKQPWRIAFQVYNNATMGMFAGSAQALKDDGTLPYTTAVVPVGSQGTKTTKVIGARGIIGDDYTPYRVSTTDPNNYFADLDKFQPHWNQKSEGFIDRRTKVWVDSISSPATSGVETPPVQPTDPLKDVSNTYPMSYYLVIGPHGFYLSIWQGAATNMKGTDFSWVLVQRPVQRDTGVVVTDGKAPVFCVNSVGNVINRFVVREADLSDASAITPATADTKDGTAIINDKRQVGVSENNQYIVNYPSRLNTPRYAYTYELDMIGYASATVVSGTTEIPQTLYGEGAPRTYIGMHSNLENNNGMRIVAIKAGPGIDELGGLLAPVAP